MNVTESLSKCFIFLICLPGQVVDMINKVRHPIKFEIVEEVGNMVVIRVLNRKIIEANEIILLARKNSYKLGNMVDLDIYLRNSNLGFDFQIIALGSTKRPSVVEMVASSSSWFSTPMWYTNQGIWDKECLFLLKRN